MMRPDRLDRDRTMVLVIDIQTALLPAIANKEPMLQACRKLLEGIKVFSLPVLATEQYPKGIGKTEGSIAQRLEACRARVMEKMAFSSCGEQPLRDALGEIKRNQVVVIGIESHVCVQQTTLDLLAMDYQVFVCADAIGSRGRLDYKTALLRMRHAGANVTTVESVLFELCERCDVPLFKEMLSVIKAYPPSGVN